MDLSPVIENAERGKGFAFLSLGDEEPLF